MALSDALTSTVVLRALQRNITGAVKNRAAAADPVMIAILARDPVIGPMIGALLERTSLIDLGQAKAAAVAEGAAQTAATVPTITSIAPSPTRREFARDLKDSERSFLAGLGRGADLAPDILDSFVMEGADVWLNTVLDDVLGLATSASYSIGTTGTALAWAGLQNGFLDHVNRGAGSPEGVFVGIKVKGIKDLAADVLSLDGAVQFASQVQQFLNIGRTGYIGEFFGGMRLYMLDDVATSGVDDVGLMVSASGIQTRHDIVPLPEESAMVVVQASAGGAWVSCEAKRSTTTSAVTRIEHSFREGVAVLDAAGLTKVVYKSS